MRASQGSEQTLDEEYLPSRPLPVLWAAHELPQLVEVLSGGSADLEEMARPQDAGKAPHMGEVRADPAPPSATATPDHALLGQGGESYLRNPLG